MRSSLPGVWTADTGFISAASPMDVWAWGAGTAFTVIAVALWLASRWTDRLALRIFALRYGLAALGWFFAYPRAVHQGTLLSFPSVVLGVSLIVLTLLALDVYLGRFRWRRLALQATLALLACLLLRWGADQAPDDPRGLLAVFGLGMAWCAATAFAAARRERNAGHLIIAGAFASYPAVLVLATLAAPRLPPLELSYLVAVPTSVAGVAVLLASLIRFSRRLEVELAARAAAENQVREFNASLEARVAERTAELQRLVHGLEGFTRSVSHDLRGPLAGIAGIARLAEEALARGDVQRVQRLLAPLAPQADSLGSMVQDLLRLSRVTQGECQRQQQALQPVVDAALRQLALAPESSALLPEVTIELGPLPDARIDAALMQQVFVNLLANALRFARATSDRPAVRVGADHSPGHVTYFVADNGPGIPAGRERELFRPFSRLHGPTLSHNGIGLSIVQAIIDKHRGRIWAERAPGGGAVFRFELDALAANAQAA